MRGASTENSERRRSPRFSCGGQAKIICLPSDGTLLPGRIRDLSLGGCSVETVSPLGWGARAEVLVQINTSSFRALSQVRALHGPYGIGMQFLHLSPGGQDMLVELIRELARQNAIAGTLRAARREPDQDRWDECRAALLQESSPMLGRIIVSENSAARPLAVERSALADEDAKEFPLDLFI